jgi:hypothetical protein
MRKLTLAALCIGFLAPSGSSAAVELQFGTGMAGSGGAVVDLGSIDQDPSNPSRNAYGFDIFIDSLTVTGTAFDGVYDVDGPLDCPMGMGASCGAMSFDTVLRTISIVGSVPDLGVSGTTLVHGFFDDFAFTILDGSARRTSFHAFGGDTKDRALLARLGFTNFSIFSFELDTLASEPFDCTDMGLTCWKVDSTDLVNSHASTLLPAEPGTLVLLGGGILGLARVRKRRHS